jgi:hypothetical protein
LRFEQHESDGGVPPMIAGPQSISFPTSHSWSAADAIVLAAAAGDGVTIITATTTATTAHIATALAMVFCKEIVEIKTRV